MGREHNFQSTALQYLNSLPGCKAENVSGNANQSGRPDITGCYKGHMFKLELKTPDHQYQASKKQLLELRKWKNAGCAVGVLYSMDALKQMFQAFDAPWEKQLFKDFESASVEGRCSEKNNCVSWYNIPGLNFVRGERDDQE